MTKKIKHIKIEKYDLEAFKKEQKPYAQILNEVIQKCPMKHANEFLLWCFLESLPETWTPNKHHIMSYFNISERSYERYMGWLNAVGLIEYRQQRDKEGTFGKWELIVLNGSKFNPDAASNRSAKIGGTVIHRLKAKVIHISKVTVPPNLAETVESSTDRASIELSEIPPFRQKTVERSNGGHINTTKRSTKEKKKTNTAVSVFSDTESVKTHFEIMLGRRCLAFDEEVINQCVFWAWDFQKENERTFDKTCKRLNFCIKAVQGGTWRIPQGWNGITSQSIRENDEKHEKVKQDQIINDAKIARTIGNAVKNRKSLAEMLKDLANANQGTMSETTVQNRSATGS